MKGWKQRKILFRGMCKHTNKWVYGDFFSDIEEEANYIRVFYTSQGDSITEEPPENCQRDYIVKIETVTQYTEKEDSNGKKIFEGDIARLCRNLVYENSVVIKYGVVRYNGVEFDLWPDTDIGHNAILFGISSDTDTSLKIIDNVFQNPELVEKYKLEVGE